MRKMKNHLFAISVLILIVLSGCTTKQPQTNNFLSSEDTLIIETNKFESSGLFKVGATQLTFKDTAEWKEIFDWFDFQFIYPKNLKETKIGFTSIMFNPLRYYDKLKHDTLQKNTSSQENQIFIVTGILDNKEVFILDQNSNKDFRDDSIRVFNKWDWKSDKNLIKCKYIIEKEQETLADSGWVKIGKWNDDTFKSTCQHLEATFSIDNIKYKLGVVDDNPTSFCFFRPLFALLGENEVMRDTLLERDLVKLNEYIKLGDLYFEVNDFYSGSGTIVLVKEENFEGKVGIQVGAFAPSFNFVSTVGDTISSSEYKNYNLLIANISGCTPSSFDVFEEIQNATNSKLKLIGINSGVEKDLEGILVDVEDEFNNDLYINYRNAYSSYDCYLVNKEGKIVDKFKIFDWKTYLTGFIGK